MRWNDMATITSEEFRTACLEFLKLSEKLGDSWKARSDIQNQDEFCIHKTQCVKSSGDRECQDEASHQEGSWQCDEVSEPFDPSALNEHSIEDFFTYDYHIVYSLSHSVPTLYFNAWHSSGKLLTLEEVWEGVNIDHNEQILSNKWSSLTQTEHPLLGKPYFHLHPCNTARLMAQVLPHFDHRSDMRKYIVSWLSMFGPVVGLEVPLYFGIEDMGTFQT